MNRTKIEEFMNDLTIDIKKYKCERYFCQFCLKGNYEISIEEAKKEPHWRCPYCTGECYCSRCSRYTRFFKLMSVYCSLGGDVLSLKESFINKNVVFNKLKHKLILNNIKVILYDETLTEKQMIQQSKKKNNKEDFSLKSIKEYKDVLIELKQYFENVFKKERIDKHLNESEMIIDGKKKNINFLNKKRNEESPSITQVNNIIKTIKIKIEV